jgi:hypothetical protein
MVNILGRCWIADSGRRYVRDRFERVESNNWGGEIGRGFRRIQSDTIVRQNMGRTLWWLSTEVMVKILGDADSRRRLCAREDWGGLRRIQSETTVRQNMGRTFWWLATEVMVKLLRRCRATTNHDVQRKIGGRRGLCTVT